MGLRERHAAQTRELILGTALTLFTEQGYEATTMEEIAERADIGTSTLYRYFPTKDQLVIEPLALRGQMAAEVRARPADEPLDLALGHALTALLSTPRPDTERLDQLGAIMASTPVVQARLREEFEKERVMLGQAIAERLGRPEDDLFCLMTARFTTSVLELVGSRDSAGAAADNRTAIHETLDFLRDLLGRLHAEPPVLPRLGG
ncbi:TetR family transcriptional regulator [Nocardioides sp. KIGAM211]|uniref:TetR family transcriptional regulator n=1 Tax=Nocardioides luti TaxID=2761101 RepID=A0A7X0RGA9_9ACTN|nr:TetR/AcrR family transcriptional regulator [Nocardioides luti]MBB6627796.1 TetR family transcriptional regulator [Nocardioides luti]